MKAYQLVLRDCHDYSDCVLHTFRTRSDAETALQIHQNGCDMGGDCELMVVTTTFGDLECAICGEHITTAKGAATIRVNHSHVVVHVTCDTPGEGAGWVLSD